MIDGEIVIDGADGAEQDFGALQQRIHPAESRVAMLAEQTPARFIAFDVLAHGDEVVMDRPLEERRVILDEIVARADHGHAARRHPRGRRALAPHR